MKLIVNDIQHNEFSVIKLSVTKLSVTKLSAVILSALCWVRYTECRNYLNVKLSVVNRYAECRYA
jgi:hypothetical protein